MGDQPPQPTLTAFEQLNADLDDLGADLTAKFAEISAEITTLKEQAAAGDRITVEQLNSLHAKVQGLDDSVTSFMTT